MDAGDGVEVAAVATARNERLDPEDGWCGNASVEAEGRWPIPTSTGPPRRVVQGRAQSRP